MKPVKTVLYILSDAAGQGGIDLLPRNHPEQQLSVVLIQEAVSLARVPADNVYALSEDAATRKVNSSYPMISYRDMLHMVFEADRVVVL
jgi:sulfur transfer complex TusBCD TusB component (DsrH family)